MALQANVHLFALLWSFLWMAVPCAAEAESSLTVLDYDLLVSGHDYSVEVARAYSHDGLGILAVTGAPNQTVDEPRLRLLHLARKLALSPPAELAKYERPELAYASGWSRGREVFKGKPDLTKGSWYAHALEDTPAVGDAAAHRFPLITAPNVWPSALVGEEFEASFKALSRALYELAGHVLRNADLAIGAGGVLRRTTHERSRLHVGRLLHYYAPAEGEAAGEEGGEGQWCGWHNDNSVITVLPPALWLREATGEPVDACEAGGLVVRTRKGRKVEVRPPQGAVLLQLGEAAQILSSGALMATPHAVLKGSSSLSREAFALFVEPHWDEQIGTADSLRALHEADAANGDVIPPLSRRLRKLPVEFGQFLADSFAEYYASSQRG
ncbi:hypothetical protein AB1Y20_001753 [Prymnesium parvum]|uniref:Fe2OG dioxygenase domain-containing protein n=1 Tax=Prymnesium parvum TaxID=97485 RepID=A0AB34KE56_PRYPA